MSFLMNCSRTSKQASCACGRRRRDGVSKGVEEGKGRKGRTWMTRERRSRCSRMRRTKVEFGEARSFRSERAAVRRSLEATGALYVESWSRQLSLRPNFEGKKEKNKTR
jgi:hypothetical protein